MLSKSVQDLLELLEKRKDDLVPFLMKKTTRSVLYELSSQGSASTQTTLAKRVGCSPGKITDMKKEIKEDLMDLDWFIITSEEDINKPHPPISLALTKVAIEYINLLKNELKKNPKLLNNINFKPKNQTKPSNKSQKVICVHHEDIPKIHEIMSLWHDSIPSVNNYDCRRTNPNSHISLIIPTITYDPSIELDFEKERIFNKCLKNHIREDFGPNFFETWDEFKKKVPLFFDNKKNLEKEIISKIKEQWKDIEITPNCEEGTFSENVLNLLFEYCCEFHDGKIEEYDRKINETTIYSSAGLFLSVDDDKLNARELRENFLKIIHKEIKENNLFREKAEVFIGVYNALIELRRNLKDSLEDHLRTRKLPWRNCKYCEPGDEFII